MAEQAPAPADTPAAVDTSTPGTDQPTTPDISQDNWQERYTEAQAWGTRNAQRVRELEADAQIVNALRSEDPHDQQWGAQQLGWQLQQPELQEEDLSRYEDPRWAELQAEVQALREARQQEEQEAIQEQNWEAFRAYAEPEMTRMGVPAELHDLISQTAADMPPIYTPQGDIPDLLGAYQRLIEWLTPAVAKVPQWSDAVKQSWAQTKQAPHISPGGTAATHQPDIGQMTRSERVDWMSQRLMDLEAQ